MFRLDKLEISGFKSFYDPAELVFPARMTAVVGPNGCGKSNICDAIIWVLGESRASHIRGETMDDVIFQGSERRKALGMGEVTLTLSTDNGHPAADDGRITINRRVFRTGESEFRLNGKRVRLKDISDILMDTGLGIRNYSVMEQGKIDLILSNKPQDRRKLIEEAAGITKYKTKRRAAELKLEETHANLVRIDDTLAEVTRNLNSLKRQAAKARRHKELIDQLSDAKRALYAGRLVIARAEEEASQSAVAGAQNAESESAALLGQQESELAETRRIHTDRSARASAMREEIARLSAESERLKSFLAQSETTLSDLVQRIDSSRTQVASLDTEAVEQQALLDEKRAGLDAAVAERNRLREAADETERNRQNHGDSVRTAEKNLGTSRETLMRTIARISESRNQVHQIEIAVEKCEFYLGKLNDTAKRVTDGLTTAQERRDREEASVQEGDTLLQQARDAVRDARTRLEELTARREDIRQSLASARDTISQTTYKIDSLRTLLTTLESQDDEVRKAILEVVPSATSAAEAVHAAEGYEAALDTILRDITKAVVVEDANTAIEAIRRLRERGAGRGTFLTLDFDRHHMAHGSGGEVAHAVVGEGVVADAVRLAVPEAYIVETIDDALACAKDRPNATFVTRDGDIVRGPLISGGRQENARGVFSIKRQLADLEQILWTEQSRVSGISETLQNVEQELKSADDARIVAAERERQAVEEQHQRVVNRDRANEELSRFEKDLAVAQEEKSLYDEEKEQLLTRRNDAIDELRQLEESERSLQGTIRSTEDELQQLRADFETITEVASKARVDLEAANGEANAAQREFENLSRIVASLSGRSHQLRSEIESLVTRHSETGTASEKGRGDLDAALNSLRDHGEQRITIESEVSELEEKVKGLESAAVAARERWNAHRQALFEAERRLDRAKSGFDLLREQIALDLHAGVEALAEVAPPADEEARTNLEAEVARLGEQIEKIGPVNVLAIEEYQELEQREQFLRTQRDDLVQSIESLRSTIRKINMTSREMFRDAFNTINGSFREIFTSLFGGGIAEMKLLDEEDVLESGIELNAQPPGKKTQSIALLSGGERALTALALLFAIFRYKPSPFCLLDEVDAPLDEVNNERFVRLVREMSRDTQFIVITHSKRTMEAADVMYGVTMEERGCSRLVSVSFADLEA